MFKIEEYLYGIDSEVHSNFISDLSSFINEFGEGDLTNNFTMNDIFSSRDHLIKWVREITHHLGFFTIIIRSDKATDGYGRKKFVLLGCERCENIRNTMQRLHINDHWKDRELNCSLW